MLIKVLVISLTTLLEVREHSGKELKASACSGISSNYKSVLILAVSYPDQKL